MDTCTGNVITIQAKNVELDLNGHAIICTGPSSSSNTICVDTNITENVVIRNGVIDHPTPGIIITGSATNNGNYTLRNLKISRFTQYGIDAFNVHGNLVIEDVRIIADTSGSYALWVDMVDHTRIRHVQAGNVNNYVIHIQRNQDVVVDNVILSKGTVGNLKIQNTRVVSITNSTFTDSPYGIRLVTSDVTTTDTTAQVLHNHVAGSTTSGISVESTNTTYSMTVKITRNSISTSSYYGITASGPVLVSVRKNRVRCYRGTSPTCFWTNATRIVCTDNIFLIKQGVGTAIVNIGSLNYTPGNWIF